MDREAKHNPLTLNALHWCWLSKLFRTTNMWEQPRILEQMVRYWDPKHGVFDLQGEVIEITLEDIYFIIGLLQRGVAMNLKGSIHGMGDLTIQDYIKTYCIPESHKLSIPILRI